MTHLSQYGSIGDDKNLFSFTLRENPDRNPPIWQVPVFQGLWEYQVGESNSPSKNKYLVSPKYEDGKYKILLRKMTLQEASIG